MSEISYKTIGGRNFMLIPCTESGKNISTQIRMITSGGMKNILSVTATSKNGVSILQYDITSLTRLSSLTQYGKLTSNQFSSLLEGMISAKEECGSYALSTSGIYLNEDYIYINGQTGKVQFAYIPTMQQTGSEQSCRELLRRLIAYGKVEYSSLTAEANDVINHPDFSYSMLEILMRKYHQGQPVQQPKSSSAPSFQPPEPQPFPPAPVSAVPPSPSIAPPPAPAPFHEPPAPAAMPNSSTKSGSGSGNGKRIFLIGLTVVISLTLIVGVCFTSVVRLPEGGIDITKLLGTAILIGALDFLLFRKLLGANPEKNSQPVKGKNPKQEKKKSAAPSPFPAPVPSKPAPFAAPVSSPPVNPPQQAAAPSQQRPAPSPVQQPFHANAMEESDVTIDFSAENMPGGLYLQSASGEKILLDKSPFLIGRDANIADYVISDTTVGRKHAEISRNGDGWVIVDQNSRNHTFINEGCLNPYTPYPISAGDTLRLAKVVLWVKDR